MTPDEFRKALDEYDARRARHGDDRSLLHSETSPFFAELTRRAREHLAAESAPDAVEAALTTWYANDAGGPWTDLLTLQGVAEMCRSDMGSALTAAKIKTAEAVAKAIETIRLSFPQEAEDLMAEAVAAECERLAELALTLHQSPEWDHCHQAVERYGAALAAAFRARGSSS